MSLLCASLLVAALGTNAPSAAPGPVTPPVAVDSATGFALGPAAREDPVAVEYRRLLDLDDLAQAEMDRWIREADVQGRAEETEALQRRINERIAEVDQAYREFLEHHPDHVDGRIAFGSFLDDTGRELSAREQWLKALELAPDNAPVHNNLAGSYGHRGPVTNAFVHYEKAIALEPQEPIYYQNFATTVFLFRKDVMAHYGLTNEQQVFDKSLALYRQARRLAPDSFLVATDLAQTYYGIQPPRNEEALAAWRYALGLAGNELEREGVRVHLARIQIQSGQFAEAQVQLNLVTNANLGTLKERLLRNLERRQHEAGADGPRGNAEAGPPAAIESPPTSEAPSPPIRRPGVP